MRSVGIQVDNVTVTYNSGSPCMVLIYSFSGSIGGLVGMNGSGKSTLFKSIMGFVKPTTGRVLINGMPIRLVKREHVAYVPQSEEVDWNFL